MKKVFKRIISMAVSLALAVALVYFGPGLYVRFFGEGNARWISERFSETLREKNELVVYEIETTGQETVSQDAWLIGTVQKVEIPYTFRMSYTVDLSYAVIEVEETSIHVKVPKPAPAYQKLSVEEENVRKVDWLYRLTPERYAQIKQELEDRLFEEYSANVMYAQNAWDIAVRNIEKLLKPVVEENLFGSLYEIEVSELPVPKESINTIQQPV